MGIRKLSFALLLAAGFAFSQPPKVKECLSLIEEGEIKCPTHYYIVEPVKLMPYLLKFHRELNLTKEQKEQIKHLIREIKREIVPLDRRIDALSEQLRRDMVEETDPRVVRAEMEYLASLKVKRSIYNYRCIQKLREILTEEQFERLLKLAKPF